MNVRWLLVTTLCCLSGQAHAQIQLKSKAVQLQGQTPPPSTPSLELQLRLDPKLPPLPQLRESDPARLEIRVLDTYRGPVYQLEAIGKTQSEILEAIVTAMNENCVVEPILKSQSYSYSKRVIRALSLKDLLAQASRSDGATTMRQSSTGTYFFTGSVVTLIPAMPSQPLPDQVLPISPQKPKNYWHKFPFNGEDVYLIPLPLAH